MSTESVKDDYNDPMWNRNKFTKPSGTFEPNLKNQLTFIPDVLPPSIFYDRELVMLLAKAERKVGELKGKGSELSNPRTHPKTDHFVNYS